MTDQITRVEIEPSMEIGAHGQGCACSGCGVPSAPVLSVHGQGCACCATTAAMARVEDVEEGVQR